MAREKMKKENIINDLSDKLKMLTQQQEKDKGKHTVKVFPFLIGQFLLDNRLVPIRTILGQFLLGQ